MCILAIYNLKLNVFRKYFSFKAINENNLLKIRLLHVELHCFHSHFLFCLLKSL